MSEIEPFAPPAPARLSPMMPPPAPTSGPVVQAPLVPSYPAPAPPAQPHISTYSVAAPSDGTSRLITDRREPNTAAVVISWIATVLFFGYMLPWAVAATRGKSNQAAIGVINLLLGWTIIGWIAALVMACQAHQVAGGATTIVVSNHAPTHEAGVSGVGPAAGWYAAPDGNGQQYWDGARWTEHRTP